MRLIRRRVTGRVLVHSREVFRIRLASGRQLELTSGQHVLKVDGWEPLTELGVGSRIAVVRRLYQPVQLKPMHDSEVIMLAHIIGDGSCIKRQPIRYASIDEANLVAVTIAATHFGVTAIRDEYAAARVTTLRLPAPFCLTHGKESDREMVGQAWPFRSAQLRQVGAGRGVCATRRTSCTVPAAPMGHRWIGPLGREDVTGTGVLRLDQPSPD